jgi:hypothetical protein
MKRFIAILSVLLIVGFRPAVTQQKMDSVWKPAHFRNLIVGQSTTKEVIAELGNPTYIGKEEDTGVPMWTYKVQEPLPGFLYVYIRHGRLSGIGLGLASSIETSEMIRLFGKGYRIVHYDFDECLGQGGSAPVFRSPNGQLEEMEFPELGVSASLNNGKVQEISYTNHPAGPAHSRCPSKQPVPSQSKPQPAHQP